MAQRVKPYLFTELTALNAMYRPKLERLIPEYIKRKNGLIPVEYSIPQIGEVLDETYGLLVYQEQIILLAELIANMDAAQAESFRLSIFQKDAEERDYFHTHFLKGGENNVHPQQKLEETFEYLWQNGCRTFCKAHIVSTTLTACNLTYVIVQKSTSYYPHSHCHLQTFSYLCSDQTNYTMAQTGQCPYCGSEDVEHYSNGTCECMECGENWRE